MIPNIASLIPSTITTLALETLSMPALGLPLQGAATQQAKSSKPVEKPAAPPSGEVSMEQLLSQIITQLFGLLEKLLPSLMNPQHAAVAGSQAAAYDAETPKNNDATPLGRYGDFLWKPSSDKDQNLVILPPAALTGKILDVKVLSPDASSTLATGRFSGIGNGEREHFRFDQPGSEFPEGAIVQLAMKDGSIYRHTVADTAQRTTR